MDVVYTAKWWFLIFIIGLTGAPLTSKIFGNFLDKGWGLSKILSTLLISYLAFLLAITRLVPLTQFSIFIYLTIYATLNLIIIKKTKDFSFGTFRKILPVIIFEEVILAFGLVLWSYVRAHQPDINGLEKFMDYGFVTSSSLTKYLPPPDMWASGEGINYYWYGHYVTGILTKLSGIPTYITYNLMLATILGFSMSGAFSLVSSLIYKVMNVKIRRLAVIGGLLSAILLNFAGNFHTPYYVWEKGRDAYWYPDATRFIGYNPDVPDKTIHEFPIYSYVVADLHAHILNLPFVILFLSLLYASLPSESKNQRKISKLHSTNYKQYTNFKSQISKLFKLLGIENMKFEISPSRIILLGVLLGVMFMGNAWDFANYLLAAGFVYLIYYVRKKGLSLDTLFTIGAPISLIIATAVIASSPFILNFDSIAEGVKLTHTKSPIWQLAILWGFPAVLTLFFLLRNARSKIREDLFILGLLATCWALIALPEFIYVKDIYAETHYRANTMFKLTYQAFVMSYLASGYITVRVLTGINKKFIRVPLLFILVLIFVSLLHYAVIATKSYYGDLKNYRGLNGETWLQTQNPDIYNAIVWLRENNTGQPTILEAPGDSYTEFDSISSYTGFPTVSGWYVHEWLWRGSPDFPQERVNEITTIYNSKYADEARPLLQKYGVKYLIVGDHEREKFPDLSEDKFSQLGSVVFDSPTTKIYQVVIQ